MTDTTDYTITAQTDHGAVIVAEVMYADLTEPPGEEQATRDEGEAAAFGADD